MGIKNFNFEVESINYGTIVEQSKKLFRVFNRDIQTLKENSGGEIIPKAGEVVKIGKFEDKDLYRARIDFTKDSNTEQFINLKGIQDLPLAYTVVESQGFIQDLDSGYLTKEYVKINRSNNIEIFSTKYSSLLSSKGVTIENYSFDAAASTKTVVNSNQNGFVLVDFYEGKIPLEGDNSSSVQ